MEKVYEVEFMNYTNCMKDDFFVGCRLVDCLYRFIFISTTLPNSDYW